MSREKKLIELLSTVVVLGVLICVVIYAQTQVPGNQATKIAPQQFKVKVMLVERAACSGNGSTNGATWNCNGLQLYRFRLSDGTVTEPIIGVPAGELARDAKWTTDFDIK